MVVNEFNRAAAVDYARKWALSRNPNFFDYSSIGGDCTNFISQILYAGCGVMNYNRSFGWYYHNANDKSPSWTAVAFLYDFLIVNQAEGPFAEQVDMKGVTVGDLVQLGFRERGHFEHSLFITKYEEPKLDRIYFAAHTQDLLDQPLTYYDVVDRRFLHIAGYRR